MELELINLMWNWNWPNGIEWNWNSQNRIDPTFASDHANYHPRPSQPQHPQELAFELHVEHIPDDFLGGMEMSMAHDTFSLRQTYYYICSRRRRLGMSTGRSTSSDSHFSNFLRWTPSYDTTTAPSKCLFWRATRLVFPTVGSWMGCAFHFT